VLPNRVLYEAGDLASTAASTLSLGLWGGAVQAAASGRLASPARRLFHRWLDQWRLLPGAARARTGQRFRKAPLPRRPRRLSGEAACGWGVAAASGCLFADLPQTRSQDFNPAPGLNSVVHRANAASPMGCACAQRTRTQLAPRDPSRSAASCYPVPGDRPPKCALLVRRCLVDAVPWPCPCSGC